MAAASEEINTKWLQAAWAAWSGEGKGKEVVGLDNAVDLEGEKGQILTHGIVEHNVCGLWSEKCLAGFSCPKGWAQHRK